MSLREREPVRADKATRICAKRESVPQCPPANCSVVAVVGLDEKGNGQYEQLVNQFRAYLGLCLIGHKQLLIEINFWCARSLQCKGVFSRGHTLCGYPGTYPSTESSMTKTTWLRTRVPKSVTLLLII